jgi:hypothetical protein
LDFEPAKGSFWRKAVIELQADQFDFSDVASGRSNVCSREKEHDDGTRSKTVIKERE